jgi:hypothetical protein
MLQTRSHYLVASAQRRQDFEQAVRDLLRTHPEVAGRETFDLPYRTVVYRARRAESRASERPIGGGIKPDRPEPIGALGNRLQGHRLRS